MNWEHSQFCGKLNLPKYENYADIEGAISNYNQNSHPIIKYTEFKNKAIKFYYKNKCNFIIKNNTFKNIYYNWRKNNTIFKKYSIFEYNKTLTGNNYLKDYQYNYLYNKSGKTQFLHEHAIFCSDYFIKKLRNAKHWYIDCTFVVPPTFKQMLVIMYRDDYTGIRYPGLFGLINNKKKEGYLNLFKKIKDIITLENTKELSLLTYSVDYEIGLLETCQNLFEKKRGVGCYYHYCKNLYNKAKKLGLMKTEFHDETKIMLEYFYKIPFIIQKIKINEYLDKIYKKYKDIKYLKLNENYETFMDYYKSEWEKYIFNGFLNYEFLKKEQRSNSYLENYNRRIKQKLSNFLLGKNKCRISRPPLLYFVIIKKMNIETIF